MDQLTTRRKILIVDDEPAIRDSLKLLLSSNYEVSLAEDGQTALEVIEEFLPDIVLMDVNMPRLDGLETLSKLNKSKTTKSGNQVPIVMLSGSATVKSAVQAMKEGAVDYINKPFDITELKAVIARSLAEADLNPAPEKASNKTCESTNSNYPKKIIGQSKAIEAVLRNVDQVAPKDTTVLISGESGTGKELIARRIHAASSRSKGPFIAVNCGAIPESLIESELFGHEKGAFTSAVERRLGLCEMANSGTLFLDEIGELSLPVQVKLLRFLQEQEFYRVGGSKPVKVDVRIIAATNRNLEKAIEDKLFRLDLYYRLNVVSIDLPPLRERFEDIPPLLEHFRSKFAAIYNKPQVDFTPEAKNLLVQYSWPGNVRELQNLIESFMAISTGEAIDSEMLPKRIRTLQTGSIKISNAQLSPTEPIKFEEAERIFEIEMIVTALKKTDYVQTRAAELLGISRRILKYKMDKLGIDSQPNMTSSVMPSTHMPQINGAASSTETGEGEIEAEILPPTNQQPLRETLNISRNS